MEKSPGKKKYKPSPSLLGMCQRRLTYWASGVPYELNPLYELRARRGQAIHLIILDAVDYVFTHDPQFANLENYHVLKQEHEITFPNGWGMIGGTPDLVLRMDWRDKLEVAVWDLKNYRNVPTEPYESNVWQCQAYIEGEALTGSNPCCGYILYFPDTGEPKAFRVNRDPGIIKFASDYFGLVEKSVLNEELPDRLDYHDIKCSYCPFWEKCWGELAEEMADVWKKQSPIDYKDLSSDVAIHAIELLACRGEIREEKEKEKIAFDGLVRYMTKEGIYSIKYPDGNTYALQYVSKKTGNGYYTYKKIAGV